MNALNRLTLSEFDKALTRHIETHYVIRDHEYHCRECGSQIEYATGDIAVHDRRFPDCAGPGRVLNVPLPYCPKCEGSPTEVRGCVHVSTFAATARRKLLLGLLIVLASAGTVIWIGMVR